MPKLNGEFCTTSRAICGQSRKMLVIVAVAAAKRGFMDKKEIEP